MGIACFEAFMRAGRGQALALDMTGRRTIAWKQDAAPSDDPVRQLVDGAWYALFVATTRDVLREEPFAFSAGSLLDVDQVALRDEAVTLVASVVAREALSLADIPGQRRALAALAGILNEVQQVAMNVEFYVWMTQNNERVRGTHANRMNAIERWDAPPEGGHPTQDFGCRCYALPLSIDSYWERVSESVEGFTADVGDWEGNVEHMYLDDVGNVTVGKGKLLPDPTVAEVMPFRYRSSDELASPEAIRDEYQVVASQQPSQQRGAAFYEQFTQLYLAQKDIDALVQSYVRENFERMLDQYPRFGNFPYPAQVALWDMIYNLGAGGLREYQNMRRAILDDGWERAAAESGRGGISPSRNQYVFDLFMSAEHLDD